MKMPPVLRMWLISFAIFGISFAYMISAETPRGQIEGTTYLNQTKQLALSDCDVYLTPNNDGDGGTRPLKTWLGWILPEDQRERRHTITDRNGKFHFRDVPAGDYSLTASAKWHNTPSLNLTVEEGKTSTLSARLVRSQPDLSVGDHQATFTTTESAFLPVRGYTAFPSTKSPTGEHPVLAVKVWRTRLSEVLKRADAAAALDKLRYSYNGNQSDFAPALLHPGTSDAETPVPVTRTAVPITNSDREGFFNLRLPLKDTRGKPGLYLVKFAYGKYSSCSYVLITDLALVVKKTPEELVAYVAQLQKGTPTRGASVQLLRNGRTLAKSQSSAEGITRFDLSRLAPAGPGASDLETPLLTLATLGADEAVLSGSNYGGDTALPRYAVHIVTDRTIYRPGDTVQYKGIVRLHQDNPDGSAGYTVPRGVPVKLEVRDVNGALVDRASKTTSAAGTIAGSVEISPEGGTGTYILTTTINGEESQSEITVAAYRKPEYAVVITPVKDRYHRGEDVEMAISATYYFGAPVAGARMHYYIYRDADWSAEYGDDFDDSEADGGFRDAAYQNYYGDSVAEGDVTLDANGKAIVRVRTDVRHPDRPNEPDAQKTDEVLPQVETYTLTASVQDSASRLVEAEGAAKVASGDLTLNITPEGYVAAPGKATTVYVTVRDPRRNPVSGATVSLSASYQEWDFKKKVNRITTVGPAQTATSGVDGRATLSVTPPRNGEMRLQATTRDSAGRIIATEASLWCASDGGDDLDTDYGDLTLLTDKRNYLPGDTARVLINASRTGQSVLLSVEGDRVYHIVSVPIKKRSTVIYLPVKAAWGPNVTLVANYVRDKKFASSQTPLRVTLEARELAVTVQAVGGQKFHPGDRVTYAIVTKDQRTGQPISSDFALSVVDESIYALREENSRALKQTFYPPRYNRVSTSFSFSVEYLGDVSKADPKIEARRKFRDTAYWKPDGHTDSSGKAQVTITLPDNLTTWRATVHAVSEATALGYARSKIVSSKPFFVRLESPRYLVGRDSSRFAAIVHNETGMDQQVKVRIAVPGLRVGAAETQSVTVPSGSSATVEWPVTMATNTSGSIPIRLTAWTLPAVGSPTYTDGIEQSLPTRAYGRVDFTTFAGTLTPEMNYQNSVPADSLSVTPNRLTFQMDPAAVPSETRLTVRVTPSVKGVLTAGLEYLVDFPYGCTEQTMSRFYPDLLVEKYGLLSDGKKKKALPRMVRDGLARLARLQHSDSGGWGWWTQDKDDPLMTAYVLVGLSTALDFGYTVDPSMIERGRTAAVDLVKKAPTGQKAFLLYALSLAGYDDSQTGILHAPFRYSSKRTGLVPSKLPTDALAYLVLLGTKLDANYRPFLAELESRGQSEGRLLHWSATRQTDTYSACTDRMATALVLRVLVSINPDDRRIPAILQYLMQSRTDTYFGDTRDTAWVIVALSDYLRTHPDESEEPHGNMSIRVNGVDAQSISLESAKLEGGEISLKLPTASLKPGVNTLEFIRDAQSSGTIYYSGAFRQTIAAPNGGELAPFARRGVTIEREILRVVPRKSGSDLWGLATEAVPNGKFHQGDSLRVRLKINTDADRSYVLIEDSFPSGAEISERGTADEDTGNSDWNFWYDYVDVRDDRIAFFVRKLPKGKHILEYNIRAQTPGISRAVPTVVQGMYDPGFRGESGSAPVEIQQ